MTLLTTVIGLLLLIGFILLVVAITGKLPWWVPVIFLFIIELLRVIPVGR